jgi:transposase
MSNDHPDVPETMSTVTASPTAEGPPATATTTEPTSAPRRASPRAMSISQQTRQEIHRLHRHYGTRRIAERLSLSRKVVRRVLKEEGFKKPRAPRSNAATAPISSKLDPFEASIRERVQSRLTTTRIFREIRALGYTGGRTILSARVRQFEAELVLEPKRAKKVKRRFETPSGEEMRVDWSPYNLPIGGRITKVHALGCLLCASRKLFLHFFRDERQSTLLEGLALAFEYFEGVALRMVIDNMATAVLGRFGTHGRPVWHPRFLDFARHYGITPFACLPRDPDRKGKKEKSFRLVEDDFLRGSSFDSWDDLDARTKVWLDGTADVANLRKHGTTGRVPNEAFLAEKQLLIQLPSRRFAVHEDGVRLVDADSTLSISGTPYTVPAALANSTVAVRLYAEHFEVLDRQGHIAFSRRYVADAEKGKLVIDPTHYANLPRSRARRAGGRIDDAFVQRFPTLAPMVDGLRLRMKSLAHVHLRALLRLADRFGEEALVRATERAQTYRRFDAGAVERILEHTAEEKEEPIAPLGGVGKTIIGEVEGETLDSYGDIDQRTPSISGSDEKDDGHGA